MNSISVWAINNNKSTAISGTLYRSFLWRSAMHFTFLEKYIGKKFAQKQLRANIEHCVVQYNYFIYTSSLAITHLIQCFKPVKYSLNINFIQPFHA